MLRQHHASRILSNTLMFLNNGTSKTINFSFATHGKLMVLAVKILMEFRVKHLVVLVFTYFYIMALKL